MPIISLRYNMMRTVIIYVDVFYFLVEGIDPPEVVDVSAFGFTVIFSEERFPDATYFIYM